MLTIKCVVACHGGYGPEVIPVMVECTQEEYDEGNHYDTAEAWARDYHEFDGPFWVCDENDHPAEKLMPLFNWEKADTIHINEEF